MVNFVNDRPVTLRNDGYDDEDDNDEKNEAETKETKKVRSDWLFMKGVESCNVDCCVVLLSSSPACCGSCSSPGRRTKATGKW